ncbi:uncharacterized protein A4U43_C08F16150 [Asparagus officinalis]|nr:uncharacterized protein A4U43_C08F16150 [Asparagus officinalis]
MSTVDRNLIAHLVSAMRSVKSALSSAGYLQILGILSASEPPSSGRFRRGYDKAIFISKYKADIQRLLASEAEIKELAFSYAAVLKEKELEEEKARVPKANPYPYTTDYPVIPPKPEPKRCTA